jgi:hypothetical protein
MNFSFWRRSASGKKYFKKKNSRRTNLKRKILKQKIYMLDKLIVKSSEKCGGRLD